MDMKDKKVLITGANKGIGQAVSMASAAKHTHLLLVMRSQSDEFKNNLIKDLKNVGAITVKIFESDLSNRSSLANLITDLKNEDIDILFNNAGLLTGGLLEEQPTADIYNMFEVNVNSLVVLTQALLPNMIKRKTGKIINHSSVSAVIHLPCASTYAAAKAAVWAFTDCLQQELRGTGVSTLCLFTPGVKTKMFDQIDVLYSKNIETPKDTITPEVYAQKIIQAIESDQFYLEPTGATGIGFGMARYFPSLFNKIVGTKFKR